MWRNKRNSKRSWIKLSGNKIWDFFFLFSSQFNDGERPPKTGRKRTSFAWKKETITTIWMIPPSLIMIKQCKFSLFCLYMLVSCLTNIIYVASTVTTTSNQTETKRIIKNRAEKKNGKTMNKKRKNTIFLIWFWIQRENCSKCFEHLESSTYYHFKISFFSSSWWVCLCCIFISFDWSPAIFRYFFFHFSLSSIKHRTNHKLCVSNVSCNRNRALLQNVKYFRQRTINDWSTTLRRVRSKTNDFSGMNEKETQTTPIAGCGKVRCVSKSERATEWERKI